MKNYSIFFLLFILQTILLTGQVDTISTIITKPYSVGAFGGLNILKHQSSIPIFFGSNDCGTYTGSNNLSYYLGLQAGYTFIPNLFTVTGRIFFDNRPSEFLATNESYTVFDQENNKYVPLKRQYNLISSLGYLSFEIAGVLSPIRKIPLGLKLSFDAGNPVISNDYQNSEQIISPSSVLFPDGSKKRLISNGSFTEAGTTVGLSFGLQYELKFQKDLYLVPELSYRIPLNNTVSKYNWQTSIIRIGLGINWKPTETKQELRELPKKQEELPHLDTAMPIVSIPKKQLIKDFDIFPFKYQETVVTQTYPLLPYIFFDSASSNLNSKYVSNISAAEFNEEKLPKKTLDIYYHILDIIGSRLSANQTSSITLTGATDGTEMYDLKDRLELANSRASSIAEYLIKKWNISKSRINIKSENYPKLPTSKSYYEGYEENRRVEIVTDNFDILSPVIHNKFMEYTPVQSNINGLVLIDENTQIKNWRMNIYNSSKAIVYTSEGTGKPEPSISIDITKEIFEKIKPGFNPQDLSAEFIIYDVNGNYEHSSTKFKAEKQLNKFEIGRLNLIVFDFDKSEITKENKNMLSAFIAHSIQPNSITKITGSTDKLGEEIYNKTLSFDRANTVNNFILNINPNLSIKEVKGIGSTNLLYDNNIPEGRFYCRTVLLEVNTPVNK